MKREETYVSPDGHDENHGQVKSVVEGSEATDLSKAVVVVKHLGTSGAELRGDGVASGEAFVGGLGEVEALAVLDVELHKAVLLKLGNDAGVMSAYLSS